VLRSVALVLVVVAAIVSFGLMLHVGQYRLSVLMLLFAVWDLAPFAGLFVAGIVSKRWRILMRAALYAVMLFVAGESVVVDTPRARSEDTRSQSFAHGSSTRRRTTPRDVGAQSSGRDPSAALRIPPAPVRRAHSC
jgi:hypothetical protein